MASQSTSSQEMDPMIVNKLWRCEREGSAEGSHTEAFYRAYQESKSRIGLPENLSDSTIYSIANHLYDQRNCTLKQIITTITDSGILHADICSDVETEQKKILRGCVLLWLRVNLTKHYDADQCATKGPFWENDQSLREAIAVQFPKSEPVRPEVDTYITDRWGRLNTAQRFTSWGYFRIRWTNDLQDHLILNDMDDLETPVIHVFHLASYLKSSRATQDLFPEGLIREMICSLGLLMWRNRKGLTDWLEMQDKNETRVWAGPLDKLVIQQDFDELGRDLSQYKFWGNRLRRIDHAFKHARPTSMRQWWVDRRDGTARSPVLIAVAALVLSSLLSLTQVIIQLVK